MLKLIVYPKTPFVISTLLCKGSTDYLKIFFDFTFETFRLCAYAKHEHSFLNIVRNLTFNITQSVIWISIKVH